MNFRLPYTLLLITLLMYNCSYERNDELVLFDPENASRKQVYVLDGDSININDGFVEVEFDVKQATSTIVFRPQKGIWDASDFRFVKCEIENRNNEPQLVELGIGNYDLTLGATIVPPLDHKILKAIIYRTEHPAYIDSVFPVMHGKPDGTLRGWMASTSDTIEYIKLLFPELKSGASVRIGKIWLEEPYILQTAKELKEKYYPFVDEFGQYMYGEWPAKIHEISDLLRYDSLESAALRKRTSWPDWDKYGGWKNGPQQEATGRFRVEKINGKWWFVDPNGKLFWSLGMDCVEYGTQTRTRISGREHYFQYLPPEGSPESELYSYVLDEGDTTKWLSFNALNLFRKYGTAWKTISADRLHRRFNDWGMNTIGNWSDPEIYKKRKTPYVLTAYSRKTGIIADPYADGFQEDLEKTLSSKEEELYDPWCLGVFIDNELKWGVKWAPKIPEQILIAPEDQPAKIHFIDRMKEKYITINALNETWNSDFDDWNVLRKNREVIVGAESDMHDFMKEFTASYFSKCREAVKNVDPDMLYMGCRMDFHLYPEDTSLNYIIRIASEYCDVVSFNRYRYTCSSLVPPGSGDYPIIIGEFHFGSLETGLLQPGLRYAADPSERAAFFDHYIRSALTNPYIVGAHWFQLVDQSVTGRPDGENYQAGFLTVGDVPQIEIIERSSDLGHSMYRIRSNN